MLDNVAGLSFLASVWGFVGSSCPYAFVLRPEAGQTGGAPPARRFPGCCRLLIMKLFVGYDLALTNSL
jgi:hypothetical protein